MECNCFTYNAILLLLPPLLLLPLPFFLRIYYYWKKEFIQREKKLIDVCVERKGGEEGLNRNLYGTVRRKNDNKSETTQEFTNEKKY